VGSLLNAVSGSLTIGREGGVVGTDGSRREVDEF
jgi:hypothetical protein